MESEKRKREGFERWFQGWAGSYLGMAKKTGRREDAQTANDFLNSHANLYDAYVAGYDKAVSDVTNKILAQVNNYGE